MSHRWLVCPCGGFIPSGVGVVSTGTAVVVTVGAGAVAIGAWLVAGAGGAGVDAGFVIDGRNSAGRRA